MGNGQITIRHAGLVICESCPYSAFSFNASAFFARRCPLKHRRIGPGLIQINDRNSRQPPRARLDPYLGCFRQPGLLLQASTAPQCRRDLPFVPLLGRYVSRSPVSDLELPPPPPHPSPIASRTRSLQRSVASRNSAIAATGSSRLKSLEILRKPVQVAFADVAAFRQAHQRLNPLLASARSGSTNPGSTRSAESRPSRVRPGVHLVAAPNGILVIVTPGTLTTPLLTCLCWWLSLTLRGADGFGVTLPLPLRPVSTTTLPASGSRIDRCNRSDVLYFDVFHGIMTHVRHRSKSGLGTIGGLCCRNFRSGPSEIVQHAFSNAAVAGCTNGSSFSNHRTRLVSQPYAPSILAF